MSEAEIQTRAVDYIKLAYPNAKYCATLGGVRVTSFKQRVMLKRTGYVKGVPDLQIMQGRGSYYGMFLEIKKDKKSYPTPEQKIWIEYLNKENYYAVIAKGLTMVLDEIDNYMKMSKTKCCGCNKN